MRIRINKELEKDKDDRYEDEIERLAEEGERILREEGYLNEEEERANGNMDIDIVEAMIDRKFDLADRKQRNQAIESIEKEQVSMIIIDPVGACDYVWGDLVSIRSSQLFHGFSRSHGFASKCTRAA